MCLILQVRLDPLCIVRRLQGYDSRGGTPDLNASNSQSFAGTRLKSRGVKQRPSLISAQDR
jgi:hypothetical protein